MFFGRKKDKANTAGSTQQQSQRPVSILQESELSKLQSPKQTNVYKERSAMDFQAEELARLQGQANNGQKKLESRNPGSPATPQQQRPVVVPKLSIPSPGGNTGDTTIAEDRDARFQRLKSQLEISLRSGIIEDIVAGYRNLGQHFMEGRSMGDQQAAKKMFEKALEYANKRAQQEKTPEQSPVAKIQSRSPPESAPKKANRERPSVSQGQQSPTSQDNDNQIEKSDDDSDSASPSQNSEDRNAIVKAGETPPALPKDSIALAGKTKAAQGDSSSASKRETAVDDTTTKYELVEHSNGRRSLTLIRAPLPGKPIPQDGLVGVGFSFVTQPDGSQVISSMAPTGSAASSGQMVPGDELISVNGAAVKGKSTEEIIQLVKGKPGTKVTLMLASRASNGLQNLKQVSSPQRGKSQQPEQQVNKENTSVRARVQQMQKKLVSGTNAQNATEPPTTATSPDSIQNARNADSTDVGVQEAVKITEPRPTQITQSAMHDHGKQPNVVIPQNPLAPLHNHPHNGAATNNNTHLSAGAVQPSSFLPPEPAMPAPRNVPVQPAAQPAAMNGRPQAAAPTPPVTQLQHGTILSGPAPTQAKAATSAPQAFQEDLQGPSFSAQPIFSAEVQPNAMQSVVIHSFGPTPAMVHSRQVFQSPTSNQSPPQGRRKGKRMVFTREPIRGQVVLPEHPVGIGLSVSSSEKGGHPFYVDSILPDSAAAMSGQVRPGDVLYSIDGVRVKGKSLHEVIQMIKGPTGTQVTIIFQAQEPGPNPSPIPRNPAQSPFSASRKHAAVQSFEMRIDIVSAEGLPIQSTTCDPFACVSLLHEGTPIERLQQHLRNHKLNAQIRTKVLRRTTNPAWREQHVLRELFTVDPVDVDREFSWSDKDSLNGQPVVFLITSHDQAVAAGRDDFVGHAVLHNVRVGPLSDHWLPLLDRNGNTISNTGQDALVHVRISYGSSQVETHQTEAAQKAAEMAMARKRREEKAALDAQRHDPGRFSDVGGRREFDGVVMRSQSGMRGEQLVALQPPTTPSHLQGIPASHSDFATSPAPHTPAAWRGNAAAPSPMVVWNDSGGIERHEKNFDLPRRTVESRPMEASNHSAVLDMSLVEQSRREVEAKEKELQALQAELARTKDRLAELNQLHNMSTAASEQTIATLKVAIADRDEQVRNLQIMTEQAVPAQQRLEEQLRSAQQLVRGSLLQHERYEAQAEEHLKEISQLRKDNERLERELALNKKEQSQTNTNGVQSLEELVEFERMRFKKALADERARSSEALEKERTHYEKLLREVRMEATRQMDLALAESTAAKDDRKAIMRECQKCMEEAQVLRNSVLHEKQLAVSAFHDFRDQIQILRKQMLGPETEASALVQRGGNGEISRDEMFRNRESLVKRGSRGTFGQDDPARELLQMDPADREKERYEVELKLYENVMDRFNTEKAGNDDYSNTVETPRKRRMGSSVEDETQAELALKLKEKDRQLAKLQREYKRLQVIAAGRSPMTVRNASPGW